MRPDHTARLSHGKNFEPKSPDSRAHHLKDSGHRITPVSPGRKSSPVWVWKTHICEGKAKGGKAYCSSSHKPHSLNCWKDSRNLGMLVLMIMWCVLCWWKEGVSCKEIQVPYEFTTQTPRSSGEGQPVCVGGCSFLKYPAVLSSSHPIFQRGGPGLSPP